MRLEFAKEGKDLLFACEWCLEVGGKVLKIG